MCFMMFYYVRQCLASRATTIVAALTTADHLRDCNNAAGIGDNSTGIGDNSAEIGDDAAACRERRYHCESDPMLNSILKGDWSNSVPGGQIPEG